MKYGGQARRRSLTRNARGAQIRAVRQRSNGVYTSVRNVPAEAIAAPQGAAQAGSQAAPQVRSGRRRVAVSRTVILLGLVSLFTDLSQEMVTAVLPLYLTYQVRLSPLQFGFIDGMYQGATALVRLLGGMLADRKERHKEVAAAGYGASAICKLGLVIVSGAWLGTTAVLLVDRLGKGIRTAPRDAMISLSSDGANLGRSFGVHRALDTVGAMLGPLAAFVLLAQLPGAYDSIFLIAFSIALIGLGILLAFVDNRHTATADDEQPAEPKEKVTFRMALGLFRVARFRIIALVGSGLGLLTVSDAFVYLVIQRQTHLDVKWFPLLFLGTAMAYLGFAVPIGRIADRVGRGRVFLAGHLALLGVYAILRFADLGAGAVLCSLLLFGLYYASTDGVLMALASPTIPERLRTSGFALITTGTATTRFLSSVVFGAVWVAWGPQASMLLFLVGLAVMLPAAAIALRAHPEAARA
jgi:MFS family permease